MDIEDCNARSYITGICSSWKVSGCVRPASTALRPPGIPRCFPGIGIQGAPGYLQQGTGSLEFRDNPGTTQRWGKSGRQGIEGREGWNSRGWKEGGGKAGMLWPLPEVGSEGFRDLGGAGDSRSGSRRDLGFVGIAGFGRDRSELGSG
ncbi:collagen alpha-2(IV) chain-like [Corvus hawaiiensis]|uniref:collagen alpha-2(IV) chain-like n=1 Tax=Corvus hawaiiensis TaxID=134902 RepID=UPI002019CE87|nr:collagen alpha-2(IV) chain-like [Corvus hawaiiensis]